MRLTFFITNCSWVIGLGSLWVLLLVTLWWGITSLAALMIQSLMVIHIEFNVLIERIESTFRLAKLAQELTKWSVVCPNWVHRLSSILS